ncbi:hypothetical protein AV656_11820 [Bhargavaea cecembensis]|uniref:Uncharacterized protein n=1 Tax=Bhargavaea cecembensis TaxID=394098 RepID=A0A161RCJ4_9BACL|nr:hypothetical protein AV656_11820 [Bhargavaea cecembensis]
MEKSRFSITFYIIAIILLLAIVSDLFNLNVMAVFPLLVEWATKYILPWIILYWLVRLVRSIEKK